MNESVAERRMRWTLVGAAVIAAAAHVPGVPEHLVDAPYMGVLFLLFAATCAGVAAVVASRPSWGAYAAAATLCGAAVLTYGATRLVALPQLDDDVGHWAEPLGLLSVATELVVLACAVALIRRATRTAVPPDAAVAMSVPRPVSR